MGIILWTGPSLKKEKCYSSLSAVQKPNSKCVMTFKVVSPIRTLEAPQMGDREGPPTKGGPQNLPTRQLQFEEGKLPCNCKKQPDAFNDHC